jgi:hypothetical protein
MSFSSLQVLADGSAGYAVRRLLQDGEPRAAVYRSWPGPRDPHRTYRQVARIRNRLWLVAAGLHSENAL